MQPVTLYIAVNVISPTLCHSPPTIPTEDGGSPAKEAPIPRPIQSPSPEHFLSLSHHRPVEAGNNKLQCREEAPPTSTKDLRLVLDQVNQAMERIDRSNTWQGAVGRIKWVMDTLSPIAEVRAISF